MYVKNLSIKNFRYFDKNGVYVGFENDATGIVGKNGNGKTSVLEPLNYLTLNIFSA